MFHSFEKIGLIIALLLFIQPDVNSKDLNNYTFIISDFSNAPVSMQAVKNGLHYRWSGLSITLNYNKEGNNLLLSPVANKITFQDFADYLKPVINQNPDRVIPIFINYTGPAEALKKAFTESGLSEKLFYLPSGERWPDVEDILANKKNLIVFTFQKARTGNSLFHYAWDYIAEYPNSGIEDPQFDGFYPNGDITKELLLIRDLDIPETQGHRDFVLDINQNQYYINHLLNRWKHTGKRPNFIFSEKSNRFMLPIFPWLNTYKSISGIVKIGEKPLEKVFWKHSNRSISNGSFNFPYLEGEELNLTPYYPGYSFNPKSVTINDEHFITPLTFNATPLTMDEALTGYFPFDNSWLNIANKEEKIKPVNVSFTTDVNRGEVAKLPKNAYIEIGSPDRYGMRGNSFTVSAWIKLNEADSTNDQSILGTSETAYRKGLHLVIREQRPYFGFYGNDQWATKTVPPLEWHHVVYRYNYFNGEQAIFVDGENVGASFNHSSFIGDSTLLIGNSIAQKNFLDGYMDDLFIWSRPLGIEEIQTLYNSGFKPNFTKPSLLSYYRGIPLLIIIMAFIFISYKIIKIRKGRITKPNTARHSKSYTNDQKNALCLFGEFQVYNSEGKELSGSFTPKIKELFLLLLISTIKNPKGIKTEKLTSILWGGFPPAKAANNRSVSFNKLRKIIKTVEGLEIAYNNGYWKVIIGEGLYFDYQQAFSILKDKNNPSREEMELFFHFVKKGVFLNEIHWEWLDEMRGFVTNEIIDTLLRYSSLLDRDEDRELLKAIAERILAIDDLHEKAQKILISLLADGGNINLAKYQFNLFANSYKRTYGEEYKLNFDEFLSANHRES